MQRQAAAANLPGSFTLVGHQPLLNRGMNAAIAVHKNYVYVGSRTDLKPATSPKAGIMVINVSNPANPEYVRTFEANARESSRELRVWRSQDVLIVLNTNCGGTGAHNCTGNNTGMRFYDIAGENAATPQLLFDFDEDTHEFFIWEDPKNPKRALLFASSATQRFQIYDISPVLNQQSPVELFDGNHGFGNSTGSGIHSFSVSNDGKRIYHALLTRGFGIGDVSSTRTPTPPRPGTG